MTALKRLVAGLIGVSFTSLGAALVAAFLVVLITHRDAAALLGLVPSGLAMVLGPMILTRIAYDATCDDHGLTLRFVFRQEYLPWACVQSYRKVGVTWGGAADDARIRGRIFVILEYERAQSRTRAWAYFWMIGLGPAFSDSAQEYRTALDDYIPVKNRPHGRGSIGMIVALCVALSATQLAADVDDVLGTVRRALATGDHEQIVSLFRYFDETVSRADAAKDRKDVAAFFGILERRFGRPERFEPTRQTSGNFVNVYIESATPDLWRNSECVFRTYAYRAAYRAGSVQRHAEVLAEACLNEQFRAVWLKRVDIHFTDPDRSTVAMARQFFEEWRRQIGGMKRT